MKKHALLAIGLAAICLCGRLAAQTVEMIYVEGEVVNVVENIPLPFCEVQMLKGTKAVSHAKCDGAGNYVIPAMPAGEYALLITQFGDTTDLKQINLVEIKILAPRHMLAKMGLLITSPNDPRLWNFSGEMDGNDRSAAVADPGSCNEYLNSNRGLKVHPRNSVMKNELILFGRILDTYIPPPADTAGKKD